MSFTRLKYQLEGELARLIKHADTANARVGPTDESQFQQYVATLQGDITIIKYVLDELDSLINKFEVLVANDNDPTKTATLNTLANGSQTSTGYMPAMKTARDILSNVIANKSTYESLITAARSATAAATSSKSNTAPAPVYQPNFAHFLIPKIEYDKYSGDMKKYDYFKKRYASIHNNTSLSDEEKMNIFLSLLEGPAKEAVQQLNITATNYPIALKILEDKFGNKQRNIKSLHNEFNGLLCLGNTVKDARDTFDKSELLLNQLESLGEDVTQMSMHVHWEKSIIPDWLYEQMLMKIDVHSTFKQFREEAEKTLRIKEQVDSRKQEFATTYTNAVVKSSGKRKPKSKSKNATTDDQQQNKNEPKEKPKQPCFFCDGDHWSNECPKYRTAEERIKITKDNKRCLSCLKPGHFTSKCQKQRNCYHCKKRGHHKHLCYSKYPSSTPRNTKTNTVSNSSRSNSPSKCTAPSPVPVTTTAAAIQEGDTVLPILEIPVANPKVKEFHTVPALMDSGSMLSYITNECAKRLNLPLIKNTPIYSLLVQYKNGEQENIYLRGVENITKQLTMACMNRFFKYFKCKTLPSGYYHANTPFGPVVCGKGPKLTTTNTVTLTVPSKSFDAMERLEKKVEFQWKYESVGIFDDPKTTYR
jgi:hypothetical protein